MKSGKQRIIMEFILGYHTCMLTMGHMVIPEWILNLISLTRTHVRMLCTVLHIMTNDAFDLMHMQCATFISWLYYCNCCLQHEKVVVEFQSTEICQLTSCEEKMLHEV